MNYINIYAKDLQVKYSNRRHKSNEEKTQGEKN